MINNKILNRCKFKSVWMQTHHGLSSFAELLNQIPVPDRLSLFTVAT